MFTPMFNVRCNVRSSKYGPATPPSESWDIWSVLIVLVDVIAERPVADRHGHTFEFEERPVGGVAIKQEGSPLPASTLDACLASDAVLLGAVGAPEHDKLPAQARPEAGLLALRNGLGAYANLRPVTAYEAISECSPLRPEIASDADILIVRELLGGLYFGQPRGMLSEGATASAFNTMRY